MTKRYPLRSAFGGGDSGDTGDFQGVTLGISQAFYGADDGGGHFYEAAGDGGAGGYSFGGDVYHFNVSGRVVMRELFHGA